MKFLATIIFLIGMAPGAVLPLAIKEKLLSPPVCLEEEPGPPEGPVDTGNVPDTGEVSMHVGPAGSALRPSAFSFSKSDLRSIQFWHVQPPVLHYAARNVLPITWIRGHQAIMAPDHCVAHQSSVTFSPIASLAPPVSVPNSAASA
jgi:hypothetical protein